MHRPVPDGAPGSGTGMKQVRDTTAMIEAAGKFKLAQSLYQFSQFIVRITPAPQVGMDHLIVGFIFSQRIWYNIAQNSSQPSYMKVFGGSLAVFFFQLRLPPLRKRCRQQGRSRRATQNSSGLQTSRNEGRINHRLAGSRGLSLCKTHPTLMALVRSGHKIKKHRTKREETEMSV